MKRPLYNCGKGETDSEPRNERCEKAGDDLHDS